MRLGGYVAWFLSLTGMKTHQAQCMQQRLELAQLCASSYLIDYSIALFSQLIELPGKLGFIGKIVGFQLVVMQVVKFFMEWLLPKVTNVLPAFRPDTFAGWNSDPGCLEKVFTEEVFSPDWLLTVEQSDQAVALRLQRWF